MAQFRWSLVVRMSMLCIQVGVLVSETFIFCDYWRFFPTHTIILWPVVSTLQKVQRGWQYLALGYVGEDHAERGPRMHLGKKCVAMSSAEADRCSFFGAAGMQSSCRVWMCIWDYLIFLFKDPGERIQAGWSSPLSPVMHPPWRLIVWFCKMRLNRLNSAKVRHTGLSSFYFLACKLHF